MSQDMAEQNIQMWKVKKLIKSLDSARGFVYPRLQTFFNPNRLQQSWYFHDQSDLTSKSMLSRCSDLMWMFIVQALQDQISRASAMLTQEYGTASNIKS